MARKQRKGPKDPAQPDGPKEPRKPGKPDYERPRHRPEGREHQVHKEILERRMRGGPEPTPEAYRRALDQWKDLPGSIVRPPTDVTVPADEKASETPAKKDESDEDDSKGSSAPEKQK